MTQSKLRMLSQHQETLEKCVYCPKLCRATCPVSNALPSESVTPWGKMSSAYFLARGDTPLEPEHAALAWACTGCHACKSRCDHQNEVAAVLLDARAALSTERLAPEGAQRALAIARERDRPVRRSQEGSVGLLVGCGYEKHLPDESAAAARVVEKLLGAAPVPVSVCCGSAYRMAGDRAGFDRAADRFSKSVAGLSLLVVHDPGCARTLLADYAKLDASLPQVKLLVDLAEEHLARFQPLAGAPQVRYHDPCQLGRGLGRYDGPRRLLERVLSQSPLEFDRRRAEADCSGAGGLLPLTYPEVSREAAKRRLAQHEELGGGPVVTACAGSVRRFRSQGQATDDIVTWLDRALSDR